MAFIFRQLGYLPDDYKKKLEDVGVNYDWFISQALLFHPDLTETKH